MDQAPKQQNKKHIQKDMKKQSKGIGRYTKKIIGTLLDHEDSYQNQQPKETYRPQEEE
jgi:hypothetical protein